MFYESDVRHQIEAYCKENDYTITDFRINPCNGVWHEGFTGFKLSYNQGTLRCALTEMPSGCGIMLFHSFYNTDGNLKAMLPILDILFANTKGVGTIIATQGEYYDQDKNPLEEWQFEPLITYPNLQHTQPYTQTLYKKTIR